MRLHVQSLYTFETASLIVTEIPGGPGQKGADAIKARIDGLGMRLIETRVCPHDPAALAAELGKARGDILLILTGSATSDAQDVAPAALRQAGAAAATTATASKVGSTREMD